MQFRQFARSSKECSRLRRIFASAATRTALPPLHVESIVNLNLRQPPSQFISILNCPSFRGAQLAILDYCFLCRLTISPVLVVQAILPSLLLMCA